MTHGTKLWKIILQLSILVFLIRLGLFAKPKALEANLFLFTVSIVCRTAKNECHIQSTSLLWLCHFCSPHCLLQSKASLYESEGDISTNNARICVDRSTSTKNFKNLRSCIYLGKIITDSIFQSQAVHLNI